MEGVSVVIATLGLSKSIIETIEMLNNNTVKPSEIIICIPKSYVDNLSKISFHQNVKILVTKEAGQVYQRSEGFKKAVYDYVMQIDDDFFIEDNLIETLCREINLQKFPIAIAPSLINMENGVSFYFRKQNIVELFFRWIINGTCIIQPGSITKAGINFGVDFANLAEDSITEVEWIPGGCMMLKKENLVLDNFFPFTGKAYCEDLIHSFLLRNQNVRLFITNKTICRTTVDLTCKLSVNQQIKRLREEMKVRFYYGRLTGRSIIRLQIFYLFTISKIILRALF